LDELIVSVRSLYLATVSFAAIYAFVGMGLFAHNRAVSNLATLDKLLALRFLTSQNDAELRQATLIDLPDFYLNALRVSFQELHATRERDVISRFTNQPIKNVNIRVNLPMRLALGGVCNVLVGQLLPGASVPLTSTMGISVLKSEDGQLISFGECGSNSELNVFVFHPDSKRFIFLIPQFLGDQFRRLDARIPMVEWQLSSISNLKKTLPSPLGQYANLNGPFLSLAIRDVDNYILSYAHARLGKFFSASVIETAAQELFAEKEKDASYFGITMSTTLFVRFSPLVLFALSFVLWLRVRRIPNVELHSNQYWFAFEADHWAGYGYAYLCAFAPLIFAVMTYALFVISQDGELTIFNYAIGLGMTNLPKGWGYTEFNVDWIAFVALLHFVILVFATKKLVQIIRANPEWV
jgi:hypothetical protein